MKDSIRSSQPVAQAFLSPSRGTLCFHTFPSSHILPSIILLSVCLPKSFLISSAFTQYFKVTQNNDQNNFFLYSPIIVKVNIQNNKALFLVTDVIMNKVNCSKQSNWLKPKSNWTLDSKPHSPSLCDNYPQSPLNA